jgi:hypothetical protein
VEDTVFEPSEEEEYQPEVLEDKYFPDECGDHFDILQPIPEGRKPCQSSFSLDFEDMASPYGSSGGERGVRRFSGVIGTIEVDDFKREFTMWCEFQKSRNTNFHPYMVWRVCQVPLFSAAMVSRADFSPRAVFKVAATICERGSSTATNAMKTEIHLEQVVDSEEDTM